SEEFGEPLLAGTAEHQPSPICQDYAVFVVEPGLELTHAVEVDDHRAMDAQEFSGVELGLECRHAVAQQMRLPSHMQPNVFALRLNPVHFVGPSKQDTPGGFDSYAFQVGRLFLPHLEDRSSLGSQPAIPLAAYSGFGSIERDQKPLTVDRLEQVVERV